MKPSACLGAILLASVIASPWAAATARAADDGDKAPALATDEAERSREAAASTQIEDALKTYVARVGRMPAGLIDPGQPYPYTYALNNRSALLKRVAREDEAARDWAGNVRSWTAGGIIDPKELTIDPTREFSYSEGYEKFRALYRLRGEERVSRSRFEEDAKPYEKRMGHPFPGLLDSRDEYPYMAAMQKHGMILAQISAENRLADNWTYYVSRWSREGLMSPAELAVDLADGNFPYARAQARIEQLHDKLLHEAEYRQKVEELARYYKDLGRTDVDLTPSPGAKTPYGDVAFKHKAVIEGLPRENEARAKLETLRRVQLRAGDPNPVSLPPRDANSTRPYGQLFDESAELFRKYAGPIKEERLPDLIEALKKRVYTAQRPFHTYHWGDRAQLGAYWSQAGRSADDPRATQKVKDAVPVYYNSNAIISGNRDGFYAAVDPNATASYGFDHPDWALQRVELPPGARFLSTFEADPLLRETQTLFGDLGCGSGWGMSAERLFISHPEKGVGGEIGACDRIARRIIDELRLDAVLYSYNLTQYKDCVGGKFNAKLAGAFLLTDNKWIRPENVRIFTKDTRDATEERKFIQKLFVENNSGYNRGYGRKLWDDIDPAKDLPSDEETQALKARNLLRCGDFVRVVPLEKRYQCVPEETNPVPGNVDELRKSIEGLGAK